MTYLQDKKKKKDLYLKMLVIIILVIVFVFGVTRLTSLLSPFAYGVLGTGQQGLSSMSEAVESSVTTKSSLQKKIKILESENENIKTKENLYSIQEKELADMREALALMDDGIVKSFTKVISSRSVYGTFLIKNTPEHKAKIGDRVVDTLGNGLGLVSQVESKIVTVRSYDSLPEPLSLYLINSEVTLDALKMSRGVLVAKTARETFVEIGDIAISTDNQTKIGVVIDYSKDEKDPFKEVYIRMSGKLQNGSLVGIIHKN